MPLSGMKTLLAEARKEGHAVGAFEVWNLESIEVVVEAAEHFGKPVILLIGPLEIGYSGIEPLARLALHAALESRVKVCIHLDHGDSYEMALQAVHAGFTAVMYDGSLLDFDKNVAITKDVVKAAHAAGVDVEGEMGKLAGKEGGLSTAEEDALQTDPEEAVRYVSLTGVDVLAVAIGTAHGFYQKEPKINLKRLEEIAARVSVPLVLHGGSKTPEDKVRQAIKLGISKVNICSELVDAFGRGFAEVYNDPAHQTSVPSMFDRGKKYALELAKEKIGLFSMLG